MKPVEEGIKPAASLTEILTQIRWIRIVQVQHQIVLGTLRALYRSSTF